MHIRNPHIHGYPLDDLVNCFPRLKAFVVAKPDGGKTVRFSEPEAVKTLNAALLFHYYQIKFWDIPAGYLCPPVPGRADYVHGIADLLAGDEGGNIPRGKCVRGLDIGMGANAVYPIIANRSYGWHMTGSDIDHVSLKSANTIIDANPILAGKINTIHQPDEKNIFEGVINLNDQFDFSMCNPPFHRSAIEAKSGSTRKMANLKRHAKKRGSNIKGKSLNELNFAGQSNELWCEGGELAFIHRMIEQSLDYAQQVNWFTTLVSKKDNLVKIQKRLKSFGVSEVKTVDMAQGQKSSRFVAWRF